MNPPVIWMKIQPVRLLAGEIIGLIKKTAHELGKCVIVVTHSKQLAQEADIVLELSQGKLTQHFDNKGGGNMGF